MTTIEITTAARRIARDLGTTPSSIKVYYDAEGHRIGGHEADMGYLERPEWMGDVAYSGRGGKVTQREVQVWLDAAASYDPACGMSKYEWIAFETYSKLDGWA